MQTWVEVATEQQRKVLIVPYDQLSSNQVGRPGTNIALVNTNQPFHILVANFSNHELDMHPRQVIAYTTPRPEAIEESYIIHIEMLGLIPEDSDIKFCKQHVDVRNIETMNKHVADQREQHMSEDERPVTADDLDLDTLHKRDEDVQNMPRKHERMR